LIDRSTTVKCATVTVIPAARAGETGRPISFGRRRCDNHGFLSREPRMSIKSDRWIRRMAQDHGMIEPFEAGQVREVDGRRIVSYGTSSYGYDVRCADEFKIFTNINSTIVDPKAFDSRTFVDFQGDVCIIPPNSFALARTVEYFRIPRDSLVVCVGKSTYARCFRGDTRVALVDGTSATLEDMARRHESGELFWGYSIGPTGQLMVSLLDAPRFIARDALVEVELDNGELIHSTPDHRFMTRQGGMTEAASLRPGDALMPLYRHLERGYEMTYQPLTGFLVPTHRLADEWNLRTGLYTDQPGTHRHHIDFDRRNNRPKNVERIDSQGYSRFPDVIAHSRGQPAYRNHRVVGVRELPGVHDTYCLTVPEAGNFGLESGVFVSNCGIIVNVTPLEPEWEGHVTLEFSNTTPLPARIYAGEGCAQMLFLQSDEVCETSYKDRGGKYQGQTGVTLPKT
jgi:deoxycytidine triphosphate deaminase